MSASALCLDAPIKVLRARVVGNRIRCAGQSLTVLRWPVLMMCQLLARSDREDCALEVSFEGEPVSLFVGSFRETAKWVPGKEWTRAP